MDLLAQASWGEETSQEKTRQQMAKWDYGIISPQGVESRLIWMINTNFIHMAHRWHLWLRFSRSYTQTYYFHCKSSRNFPGKNVLPILARKWMLSNSLHFHCIFSRGKPQAMTEHFFTSVQRSLISSRYLARWHSNIDKSKRTVSFTRTRLYFRIQKAKSNQELTLFL